MVHSYYWIVWIVGPMCSKMENPCRWFRCAHIICSSRKGLAHTHTHDQWSINTCLPSQSVGVFGSFLCIESFSRIGIYSKTFTDCHTFSFRAWIKWKKKCNYTKSLEIRSFCAKFWFLFFCCACTLISNHHFFTVITTLAMNSELFAAAVVVVHPFTTPLYGLFLLFFVFVLYNFLKLFTYKWLTEFTISDDHSHLLDVANDEKNVSREL